jgi:hypothetical protein
VRRRRSDGISPLAPRVSECLQDIRSFTFPTFQGTKTVTAEEIAAAEHVVKAMDLTRGLCPVAARWMDL